MPEICFASNWWSEALRVNPGTWVLTLACEDFSVKTLTLTTK